MAGQFNVQGYIVISRTGLFLSRSKAWWDHTNTNQATSFQQAYVHSVSDLLSGGEWAAHALEVRAATYDAGNQYTDVTGAPIPFKDFLDRHLTGRPA